LTWEGRPVHICVSKSMQGELNSPSRILLTLILVAPFTDFSKELAIAAQSNASRLATTGGQDGESCPLFGRNERPGRLCFTYSRACRTDKSEVQDRGWRDCLLREVRCFVLSAAWLYLSGSLIISRNNAERSYCDHRTPPGSEKLAQQSQTLVRGIFGTVEKLIS
jgi:hypothetical protein